MHMKMRHSLLALVAVGLMSFGCSSSDDSDDTTKTEGEKGTATPPTGAAGGSDKAWSESFAGTGGEGRSFVDDLMNNISGKASTELPVDTGAGALTTLRAEDCKPTITDGSETDADSDGIPDSLSQNYNCAITEEGGAYTLKGDVTITDKNPASKAGGYKYEMKNLNLEMSFDLGGTQFSSKTTMNGTVDVSVDGNKFTAVQDTSSTSEASAVLGQGGSTTSGINKTTIVYTADEDGNDDPFDKGTINSVTGTIKTTSTNPAFDITVGVKAEDLVKGTCEASFTSGSISFIDGLGNDTKATFKDCAATWSRNGTAITPSAG